MKLLNFVDLAYQTFILGSVTLLSGAILFTGGLETIGLVAWYGAGFLGPWQLVSSVITTIAKGLYFRWRVIHLVSSIAYIAGFAIVASIDSSASTTFEGVLGDISVTLGVLIPVVLALFYYYITLKTFRLSRTMNK